MQRAAPWLLRLGAALLLVSPLLPQARAGERTYGAVTLIQALGSKVGGVERLAIAGVLLLPVLAGALLLAGSSMPGGGPAALRLAALALLVALSFVLSTVGSLLLTDAAARTVTPSFPLSIALFTTPLLLSGAALARWMQGGLDRQTGAYERGAVALLMLLHGLVMADCGWQYLTAPLGVPFGSAGPLAGAWAAPLGSVLAAAGAALSGLPPRAAVDTAPASG